MTTKKPRHRLLVSLAPMACIALATIAASETPRPRALRETAPIQVTTRRDSLPRITVTYEDAPIASVIAAFSTFTGRTIRSSKDVSGTVTIAIKNKPWDVALKEIMAQSGYRVTFNADSTIDVGK